ncbi:hypothetical protein PRZ48_014728 [Zasmidium cellare]|uniref:Uncharacterized protein n=1 Tax=Zasmidium cellare TaxID=395010 RepID=A0ABR0DZ25_ZASCE|nr:hypothetical protein PRZ48_014728 [Zasmidium cellare]
MDTLPTSESGAKADGSFDTSLDAANATSPSQPDILTPTSAVTDKSAGLSPGAGGERLGDVLGDDEPSEYVQSPSNTGLSPRFQNDEVQQSSLPSGPSEELAPPPEDAGAARSPSIADRRGQTPHPVRFDAKTKAETLPRPTGKAPDAAEDADSTMVNILAKLELLPAVIALRASARPGADPQEAHRALRQATKARELAQLKGADPALLGQCTYYMAVATVAVGEPDQEKTIEFFEEAKRARGVSAEGEWADGWINYVLEQRQREEVAEAEEASNKPTSLLGQLINPIATVFGASFSSKASSNAPKSPPKQAGLYAQMAPGRREILATKPAAKRMALSSSGSSGGKPPVKPAAQRMAIWSSSDKEPVKPAPQRMALWSSSSTGNTKPPLPPRQPHNHKIPRSYHSSSSRPTTPPKKLVVKQDSQGNFIHLNTNLKYNAEHVFGIEVPFTLSPEQYETDSPQRTVQEENDDHHDAEGRKIRYFIVNPDPTDPSSSSVSVSAKAGASKVPSQAAAEDDDEEKVVKRKGSWIRKLSLVSPDRESGGRPKSLEAMVEEGESPGFKPEGFGGFGGGKGGKRGTV